MWQRLFGLTMILVLALVVAVNGWGPPVVIDPGHGGPGGGKFGSNGDGHGGHGPAPDELTEEWVNLRVAKFLRDSIIMQWAGSFEAILTREYDTDRTLLDERIQLAKDSNATHFISVHHNGLGLNQQGSEVWWSSREFTDSGFARTDSARDSTLAKKILLKLKAEWNYPDHCASQNTSNWMQGCDGANKDNLYILHNIRHCACVLSEASNIYNNSEENLFVDEYSGHAEQEAKSLCHGWHSYYTNMGIAQISNRACGDITGNVLVDTLTWSAPVEFCWEVLEHHLIQAATDLWENGYHYAFHHWAHYYTPPFSYPGETNDMPFWWITVNPEWGYHIYRAYYTGRPYFCNVYDPLGSGAYGIGDTMQIVYACNAGVDSTSMVDVYLDRHNGHDGYTEAIAQNIQYPNGIRWVINGPESDSCLMKVMAHDIVGNSASDTLKYTFKIKQCSRCGDANSDGNIDISDAVFLITHIFMGGATPAWCNYAKGLGDANGDGTLDISDVVYLISRIFSGGRPPHCYGMKAD
jgi:N-acetylmuramoyl-L-alanine amidase